MERISQLPDVLLLRILSSLHAKDVVATMVLSKRWRFLWMFVPKLVYDDSYHGKFSQLWLMVPKLLYDYQNIEYRRFSRFVDRSLFMNEAPVIETLNFKLGKICGGKDLQMWIRAADKGCVRELIIEINTCSSNKTPVTLPRS